MGFAEQIMLETIKPGQSVEFRVEMAETDSRP